MSQDTAPLSNNLSVRKLAGLDEISAVDWDNLSNINNPFLSYAFLQGLEQHKCLEGHGWTPYHHVIYAGNRLIGALPLYLKTNSYGEFVFDWLWADAYERAGGRYYPKLVSAIPFTPVRGPRLLIDKQYHNDKLIKTQLINEVIEFARSTGISSLHCLFTEPEDDEIYTQYDFLQRKGIQFHWHNRGYRDFNDFLDVLNSKKRKQIKRERRQIRDCGLEVEVLSGDQISMDQWRIFYDFYCNTFHRRWGSPRLTYDFFLSLSEKLPQDTLLILAKNQKKYVAGAFAMTNGSTLFGRHWGCIEQYPNLHFELCYYQTIEYCIKHGLKTLDAGVQGEHKLSRGFDPVVTCSNHWIRHEGFRQAVRDFLHQETREIDAYFANLRVHLPYKN